MVNGVEDRRKKKKHLREEWKSVLHVTVADVQGRKNEAKAGRGQTGTQAERLEATDTFEVKGQR